MGLTWIPLPLFQTPVWLCSFTDHLRSLVEKKRCFNEAASSNTITKAPLTFWTIERRRNCSCWTWTTVPFTAEAEIQGTRQFIILEPRFQKFLQEYHPYFPPISDCAASGSCPPACLCCWAKCHSLPSQSQTRHPLNSSWLSHWFTSLASGNLTVEPCSQAAFSRHSRYCCC